MNVLLFMVFLISLCIGGECMFSIQSEVAERMHKPFDSLDVRNSLDAYIWAKDASGSLRRCGIVSGVCFTSCCICIFLFTIIREPQTDNLRGATVLSAVFTLVSAGNLAWNLYRRGR